MPGLLGIERFVVGKKRSRKAGFVPAEPVSVYCLADRASVCSFLGLRNASDGDVTRFLRELRDGGMLVADPGRGRLTRRVRVEREGSVSRPSMYVLTEDGIGRARMAASKYSAALAPPEPEKRRRPQFRIVAL